MLYEVITEAIGGDLAMTSLFDVIPRQAYLERIVTEHFSGRPLSFPDWKMIGTEAVVIGKVEVRGDQMMVEMRLYDASLGNMMVGKKYTGPASQFRKMAHKFANEVLYAFTGVRRITSYNVCYTKLLRSNKCPILQRKTHDVKPQFFCLDLREDFLLSKYRFLYTVYSLRASIQTLACQ